MQTIINHTNIFEDNHTMVQTTNPHLLYPQKSFKSRGPMIYKGDAIFTNHHVSVPFGCSPAQIESELLKFVIDLVSPEEMQHIKRLFFVPVGLPGMGKSTLSKHIKLAVENNLNSNTQPKTH